MKATTIIKISPEIELTSPTLLQCRSGECGGCLNGTGKMLWIPPNTANSISLDFQYNFFDKSAESNSAIKFSAASGFNSLNSTTFSYSNPPNRAWAVANNAIDNFQLSPNLMRGSSIIRNIPFSISATGGWLFFRQPNPAISNVHDALCFEYNHEKRLITFRSF